jgi:acyl-CoA reductase-like NAD-dependent aldehyde dehydrogenase
MLEEVFGPVAPIFLFSDEREAIKVANDSESGLGASLWTENADKAAALSREIESGMVLVNSQVKSDPRIPFGGVKNSGIGRELGNTGSGNLQTQRRLACTRPQGSYRTSPSPKQLNSSAFSSKWEL